MEIGKHPMTAIDRYKIIIVGAGPAGLATALYLTQHNPQLAAETLIIEAKTHPRPKLCGGGVTVHGEEQLDQLGLEIDAPAFVVDRIVFRLGKQEFDVAQPNAMRVFERAAFDAALADGAEAKGLCIHSNERVLDLKSVENGVELTTNHARYHARVVVAADGANSTVRRKLGIRSTVGVARLLRILTPRVPADDCFFNTNTAVFDFSCVQHGVQGYMWDFPCYYGGEACMNRGIFDSRINPPPAAEREHGLFKQVFADALRDRDLDLADIPLEGHPVRWFNPKAEFSRPHILLTGDAAGVDPLFAEGISYGMEYGSIAAEMITEAFATGNYTFADYRQRILDHRMARLLKRRTFIAKHLYQYRYPPFWSVVWRLADVAPLPMQRAFAASVALLKP